MWFKLSRRGIEMLLVVLVFEFGTSQTFASEGCSSDRSNCQCIETKGEDLYCNPYFVPCAPERKAMKKAIAAAYAEEIKCYGKCNEAWGILPLYPHPWKEWRDCLDACETAFRNTIAQARLPYLMCLFQE